MVMRSLAEKWRAVTDETRAVYKRKQETERCNYDAARERWTREHPGEDPFPKRRRSALKKLLKRDPNAPKRPMNPFMAYRRQVFEQVRTEHPQLTLTETGKHIAGMWRNLDTELKQTYM